MYYPIWQRTGLALSPENGVWVREKETMKRDKDQFLDLTLNLFKPIIQSYFERPLDNAVLKYMLLSIDQSLIQYFKETTKWWSSWLELYNSIKLAPQRNIFTKYFRLGSSRNRRGETDLSVSSLCRWWSQEGPKVVWGKKDTEVCIIKKVTTGGNGVSMPLGNSERQCRLCLRVILPREQWLWVITYRPPSTICWRMMRWTLIPQHSSLCSYMSQWTLRARESPLGRTAGAWAGGQWVNSSDVGIKKSSYLSVSQEGGRTQFLHVWYKKG